MLATAMWNICPEIKKSGMKGGGVQLWSSGRSRRQWFGGQLSVVVSAVVYPHVVHHGSNEQFLYPYTNRTPIRIKKEGRFSQK